jgi:hypothetical protein
MWSTAVGTRRRERDFALAKFIEDRMPEGRKREGVPNSLVIDAKTKFRLKSKSAILRANKRGKEWKEWREKDCGRKLSWEELQGLEKLSWEELEELKLQWRRDGFAI